MFVFAWHVQGCQASVDTIAAYFRSDFDRSKHLHSEAEIWLPQRIRAGDRLQLLRLPSRELDARLACSMRLTRSIRAVHWGRSHRPDGRDLSSVPRDLRLVQKTTHVATHVQAGVLRDVKSSPLQPQAIHEQVSLSQQSRRSPSENRNVMQGQ